MPKLIPMGVWSFELSHSFAISHSSFGHLAMTSTLDRSTRYVRGQHAPLVANLAALWAVDPALAMELEERLEEPTYLTVPAKSGDATMAIGAGCGHIFLHSRHRPIDQAKRLVDSIDLSET